MITGGSNLDNESGLMEDWGPLPPLGSSSHDKFCLGEEGTCTGKQSVHPCRPNKEIRVMFMLKQNAHVATPQQTALSWQEMQGINGLSDVFSPQQSLEAHHCSFNSPSSLWEYLSLFAYRLNIYFSKGAVEQIWSEH